MAGGRGRGGGEQLDLPDRRTGQGEGGGGRRGRRQWLRTKASTAGRPWLRAGRSRWPTLKPARQAGHGSGREGAGGPHRSQHGRQAMVQGRKEPVAHTEASTAGRPWFRAGRSRWPAQKPARQAGHGSGRPPARLGSRPHRWARSASVCGAQKMTPAVRPTPPGVEPCCPSVTRTPKPISYIRNSSEVTFQSMICHDRDHPDHHQAHPQVAFQSERKEI
jgi:hypothetical protein